jgi:D-lactate dehydrogenase
MMSRICFYSTKEYDRRSFSQVNEQFGHELTFITDRLSAASLNHAQGHDAICIFVNDPVDASMMQ